jgi:ribosomal protein S27E
MMENKLDGNAAGGILQEIFPFDMTLAQTTCAGCGAIDVVGTLVVYMHPMGTTVRCPSCDTVLIRIAKTKERYFLDMRGVRVLQISATEA